MSRFLTIAVASFLLSYVAILIWDLVKGSSRWKVLAQLASVALFVLILNRLTGFPIPIYDFSGYNPLWIIFAMLVCVILGMAAQYFFNIGDKEMKLRQLLRPVVVSPIVLLPLLGSLETTGDLTPFQFISFLFLAFQSGFFWKAVLDKAAP